MFVSIMKMQQLLRPIGQFWPIQTVTIGIDIDLAQEKKWPTAEILKKWPNSISVRIGSYGSLGHHATGTIQSFWDKLCDSSNFLFLRVYEV